MYVHDEVMCCPPPLANMTSPFLASIISYKHGYFKNRVIITLLKSCSLHLSGLVLFLDIISILTTLDMIWKEQ